MSIIRIINPGGKLNFTDDGSFYYLARKIPMWGSLFNLSVFQPGNGLTNIFAPTNIGLNPGFILISYFKPEFIGILLGQLYFATVLYFSFIFLVRVFEIPEKSGAIFSAGAVVFLNKPFAHTLNLFTLLDNNSPHSQTVAIMNVILGLYILLGRKSLKENLLLLLSILSLFVYMIWSDLLWCILVAAPLIIYGLAFLSKSSKENFWKVFAGLVCLAAFLGFGFFDYLKSMQGYMSRIVFPKEIYGEIQDFSYATSYYRYGIVRIFVRGILYLSILGVFTLKNKNQKRLATGTVLSIVFLTAVSYYYVKRAGNWTYPLPLYFENSFYFLWALTAFHVITQFRYTEFIINLFRSPKLKPVRIIMIILLVVGFFKTLFIEGGHKHLIARWIDRPNDKTDITEFLVKNIAVTPGSSFRGLVTTHIGVEDEKPHNKMINYNREFENHLQFGNAHVLSGLWYYNIPTLDEYNHLYTPFLHILVTRLLSRDYDYHSKNYLFTTQLNTNILRMLGVRYIIADKDLEKKGYKQQVILTNKKASYSLRLYEVPDVNQANFSPIDIRSEPHVANVLKILGAEDFDPRKTAVLFEGLDTQVVEVKNSSLSYFKDYLNFVGSSKSTSLVVLPIQFSHCLQANNPKVRLLRVNIAETGIVFSGDINVQIKYNLGVGNTACRKADIKDVYAYGLKDMEENLFPSYMINRADYDTGYYGWKKINSCEPYIKEN